MPVRENFHPGFEGVIQDLLNVDLLVIKCILGKIAPRYLKKKLLKSPLQNWVDFKYFFKTSGRVFPNHPQKHVIPINTI